MRFSSVGKIAFRWRPRDLHRGAGLLGAALLAVGQPLAAWAVPQPLGFEHISVEGELRARIEKNLARMESPRYQPVEGGCFSAKDYEWPGDMEGRTVLALVLLEQAAGRPAVHLEATLAAFPGRMNADGFFGQNHRGNVIDEQQLSGHGWVLRGLSERYLETKDPAILRLIEKIVVELALPTRNHHRTYPIDPAQRFTAGGGAIGTEVQKLGNWRLSSDIGCDFIFMDGLMQAATLLGSPEVNALAEEMLERFLQVDLVAIKAQTHASLTGIRGLLRWAAFTGRKDLVDEAEKRFRLYLAHGISENSANYNWFGRPTHTEPCAVVDSLQVAVQLWQQTGQPFYLEQAHLIYYNALGHGQRANGGFGCDSCLGADSPLLSIKIPEAWWCCTMRGAEGLARAAEYAFMREGDTLVLPFFQSGRARLSTAGGLLEVKLESGYPLQGEVRIEVLAAPSGKSSLSFFVPSWAERPSVVLGERAIAARESDQFLTVSETLKAGDVLRYRFYQSVRSEKVNNVAARLADYRRYYLGPLLLGAEQAPDIPLPAAKAFVWDATSRSARAPGVPFALFPINDLYLRPDVSEENYQRRALWRTE